MFNFKTDNIDNEKFNTIPEEILNSFVKRAMLEAKILVDPECKEFKKITYKLYEAFCVGFIFNNIYRKEYTEEDYKK